MLFSSHYPFYCPQSLCFFGWRKPPILPLSSRGTVRKELSFHFFLSSRVPSPTLVGFIFPQPQCFFYSLSDLPRNMAWVTQNRWDLSFLFVYKAAPFFLLGGRFEESIYPLAVSSLQRIFVFVWFGTLFSYATIYLLAPLVIGRRSTFVSSLNTVLFFSSSFPFGAFRSLEGQIALLR